MRAYEWSGRVCQSLVVGEQQPANGGGDSIGREVGGCDEGRCRSAVTVPQSPSATAVPRFAHAQLCRCERESEREGVHVLYLF